MILTTNGELKMNRRNLLAGAGILSTMMLSGISFADEKKADKTGPISKDKLKKATDAAFDCIKKGEACTAHCLDMIASGDTSMKDCLPTLANMMAACAAFAKIGTYNSAKPEAMRHLASACADLCKDCAESCKTHAEHAVCKVCMDACNKCAEACTAMTA
jgi:Cys-rich four helix bundle protein (predicted Tat secretion target)